jgi:acyl carrier protein
MIAPEEGAWAFESLLRHDRAFAGYFSTTDSPWLTALAARSKFAEAFLPDLAGTGTTSTLRAEQSKLPKDDLLERLRRVVAAKVSLILRQSISPDRAFSDHGLDSLGNLELMTMLETEVGVRVTSKAIVEHDTVRTLALHLQELLSEATG